MALPRDGDRSGHQDGRRLAAGRAHAHPAWPATRWAWPSTPTSYSLTRSSTATAAPRCTSAEFANFREGKHLRTSVGRTGVCWDKACVSHCTSWRGLGGNSVSDWASLSGDEVGVAGRGWVEQPLVLVVALVRDEQTGAVPVVDRGSVHAEVLGELVDVEQAAGAQALDVAGHVVRAA